jgi:hypothetical protein
VEILHSNFFHSVSSAIAEFKEETKTMEALETILFGIEPVTALVVGVGALLLAPVIGSVGSAIAHSDQGSSAEAGTNPVTEAVNSASESLYGLAKNAVAWGLGVAEGAQATVAEANQSFQDLVAEARAEYENRQAEAPTTQEAASPKEVEIIG